MNRYARNTQVSVDRSRTEIEHQLDRFGASAFGYYKDRSSAMIQFRYRGAMVRISVPIPAKDDREFTVSPAGRKRTEAIALAAWQQEIRRRWRSLAAVVKAMLVGIEDGVLTFEQAFLPYFVWGDGRTTAEKMLGTIKKFLAAGGDMPKALPKLEDAKTTAEAPRTQRSG